MDTLQSTFEKSIAKLCVLLLLPLVISGCSTLTDAVGKFEGAGKDVAVKYPNDPTQMDHWLDNASAWRYWDVEAPDNQTVEWSFEENAISLGIQASASLNLFATVPHTVQLKVLQLTDASGFKTLAQSSGGVKTMLLEDTTMIPNAIYSESLLLAPGQITTMIITRQQDAKFVALVTGYADLVPKTSVRLITIPVVSIPAPKADVALVDKVTFGLLADDEPAIPGVVRPATIKMNIEFGDKGIDQIAAKAY